MTILIGSARLTTTVFCALVASSALAGSLSEPTTRAALPATPPASMTNWNGYYGGLTFGVARGDGTAVRSNGTGAVIELDVSNGLFPDTTDGFASDVIGGVTLGYNIQRGDFVGGIEFDLSTSEYVATSEFSRVDPGPLFPGVDTNTSYKTEVANLSTLRLRGGYTTGDTLIYGTAGLAAGRVKNEFSLNMPNFPGLVNGYSSPDWIENETRYGYVVGAGVEHRVTDRVSLKAEALYYDLEDVTVEGRDSANFPGQELDYRFDNDGFVVRIGINLTF